MTKTEDYTYKAREKIEIHTVRWEWVSEIVSSRRSVRKARARENRHTYREKRHKNQTETSIEHGER